MPENQVVIQFEGTCVNFVQQFEAALPVAHRIVLPNVSQLTSVWGHPIALHHAGFSLTNVFEDGVALNGAVLTIANPVATGLTYATSFQTVPTLSGPDGLLPTLGPSSRAVLLGHNPALAACYFDLTDGVVSSLVASGNAVYTTVTVTTNGTPLLQVTPFPTGLSSTPPEAAAPIEISTGTLFVWNEEDSGGSDYDFLISYLCAEVIPAAQPPLAPAPVTPAKPVQHSSRKLALRGFEDPGCSNSQYP